MIVGAALVEIQIHDSQSLKAKRGVVRSVKQRLRNRFNIAVAEVGGQDTWQVAQLGLTVVGAEAVVVRSVLDRSIRFIEDLHLAEVLDSQVEVLTLPHRDVIGFELEDPAQWDFEE